MMEEEVGLWKRRGRREKIENQMTWGGSLFSFWLREREREKGLR